MRVAAFPGSKDPSRSAYAEDLRRIKRHGFQRLFFRQTEGRSQSGFVADDCARCVSAPRPFDAMQKRTPACCNFAALLKRCRNHRRGVAGGWWTDATITACRFPLVAAPPARHRRRPTSTILNCASLAQARAASIWASVLAWTKRGIFPSNTGIIASHRRSDLKSGAGFFPRLPIGARDLECVADLFLRFVDFLLLIFDRFSRARVAIDSQIRPAQMHRGRRAHRHFLRRPAIQPHHGGLAGNDSALRHRKRGENAVAARRPGSIRCPG